MFAVLHKRKDKFVRVETRETTIKLWFPTSILFKSPHCIIYDYDLNNFFWSGIGLADVYVKYTEI